MIRLLHIDEAENATCAKAGLRFLPMRGVTGVRPPKESREQPIE
jgi:hypothetical protein